MKAEIDSLCAKVQETETNYNTALGAQQQFEFASAKFNQKLRSAQAVAEERITPEQGFDAMQTQLASLQVYDLIL